VVLVQGDTTATHSEVAEYTHRILFHPAVDATPVQQLRLDLPVSHSAPSAVLLAIGPEGGWVDFELDLFEAAGFRCVHMGPRILRTDVALVAAVMLARAALDRASEPGL
jgi:RsmE family RNA methyltransferase